MKQFIPPLFLFFVFSFQHSIAQNDPEYPKGFVMHVKLHNGMVTNFKSDADIYVGGVQLEPQVTAIEHLIRIGVIADGFYLNKKLQAAFGPVVSVKLATFKAGIFGSIGNINMALDHLWGTNHQMLAGGGIIADIGNLLTLGLTAHRDYYFNNWWFQSEIGLRISKKKTPVPAFNK